MKHIIMRRVYYSFALSILTSSALWQGVALGASIAAFGRLTHVAAITKNILATPFGSVPEYVATTFARSLVNGELLTVLVVVLMVTLSAMWVRKISGVLFKPQFA